MDFLGSVLGGFFIALLVATALTFGFVLLMWFIGLGVALTVAVMLRDLWRRWYFLRRAAPRRDEPPKVIEGEYRDVSRK